MHRDDAIFPFRQATRLINEYQRGIDDIFLDVVEGDHARMVVLLMLYRAALRGDQCRISMNAIATSLSASPETIRRQVHALAQDAFCVARPRRMDLADDFLVRADLMACGDRLLLWFERLLAGFERSGFRLPAGARDQRRAMTLAAALDIFLAVFELNEGVHGSWAQLRVVGAITVHNASGITHDPALAERYGYTHTRPPPDLRRPLAIATIAAQGGLSYTTVWRHIDLLRRAGVIEERDGGYLLTEAFLFSPAIEERSRTKVHYVRRVLAGLASGRPGRVCRA